MLSCRCTLRAADSPLESLVLSPPARLFWQFIFLRYLQGRLHSNPIIFPGLKFRVVLFWRETKRGQVQQHPERGDSWIVCPQTCECAQVENESLHWEQTREKCLEATTVHKLRDVDGHSGEILISEGWNEIFAFFRNERSCDRSWRLETPVATE